MIFTGCYGRTTAKLLRNLAIWQMGSRSTNRQLRRRGGGAGYAGEAKDPVGAAVPVFPQRVHQIARDTDEFC
jgi:hypothetical protein